MKSVLLNDLDEIIKKNQINSSIYSSIKEIGAPVSTEIIVVFDLAGSSLAKTEHGHDKGIELILFHNLVCRAIIKKFGGTVVKEIGDGILARFKDPVNACLTALNFKECLMRKNLATKIVLGLGLIEDIKVNGWSDIMGSIVDKCSKIEKFAIPNQILIDRALHDTASSLLKNYEEIIISKPLPIELKEYGKQDFYEISLKKDGLHNSINRNSIHDDSRNLVTAIVIFDIDPQNQQQLIGILKKFEEVIGCQDGVISTTLKKNTDGTKIVSHTQCIGSQDIKNIFQSAAVESCLDEASKVSKQILHFYETINTSK